MGTIDNLFPPDQLSILFRAVLDFGMYFLASLLGALTREQLFEKTFKWGRISAYSILSSTLFFGLSTQVTSIFDDPRLIFLLSFLLALSSPLLKDSIKDGKLLKAILKSLTSNIVGIFHDVLKDSYKDKEKEDK